MKLTKAVITNYRSIASTELDFSHGCQVLVGINESGKSNILKALQFLDTEINSDPNDLRMERGDESPVNEGAVQFHFDLNDQQIDKIYAALTSKTNADSISMPALIYQERPITLFEFCKMRCNGLYEIDIKTGYREFDYWALPEKSFSIIDGWKKSKVDGEFTLVNNSSAKSKVGADQYFQSSLYNLVDQLTTEVITAEEIDAVIGAQVVAMMKNSLPKCVYWRYSDQYLLPSKVALASFIQDPNSCIPLKSMFELAGYKGDQISAAINGSRQSQPHRYINLLKRVSEAATKHMHSVWRDHKTVSIELQANGEEIIPVIKDEHIRLDMANRSDGFKRLVSFILQVSAKVKTSELRNTVILVDEPEVALHPRGAKSLMNELIQVGVSNTVIYSTHSIFMIDRDCIDRHLIVEKKNEITTIRRAEKSRVQDEEVLYSAIGYSIFETLKAKNIVFEGWRDKELFRVVQESAVKKDKSLKNSLDSLGLTFAEGVKDVRNVGKFLELANRPVLIISDGDAAGLNGQKEHQRTNSWGTWKTISEILANSSIVSSEDLLTPASIIKRTDQYRKKLSQLPGLTTDAFTTGTNAVRVLDTWLKNLQLEQEAHKEAMNQLKNFLFEKLRPEEIRHEAAGLIQYVSTFDFESDLNSA